MATWCPGAGGPQSFGGDTEMASARPAAPDPGLPSPHAGREGDAASSELSPAQEPPLTSGSPSASAAHRVNHGGGTERRKAGSF